MNMAYTKNEDGTKNRFHLPENGLVTLKLKGNEIIVDSTAYSQDEAYSKSINEKLVQLFKNDINPTK